MNTYFLICHYVILIDTYVYIPTYGKTYRVSRVAPTTKFPYTDIMQRRWTLRTERTSVVRMRPNLYIHISCVRVGNNNNNNNNKDSTIRTSGRLRKK